MFCSVVVYREQETEHSPSVALAQRRGMTPLFSPPSAASSQRPGQVAEVNGATQASICFQQGHDDCHSCLIIAGAAGARIIHDVYAQVGIVT